MKGFFQRLLNGRSTQPVTVVSGLPRSGTSMMMQMLAAGGIPPLTDRQRTADDDNPQGYYEFERVKQLDKGDSDWLVDAEGKAVKVISQLLKHLPAGQQYRVIFMRRDMVEILASQKKMLINRGEDASKADDAEIARLFEKHLQYVTTWLASQPNVAVLYVPYHEMLADPLAQSRRVNAFLGGQLDVAAMAAVADPSLYRNRRESAAASG